MEKAKLSYKFVSGTSKKSGKDWKAISVKGVSDDDSKVYKGLVFCKEIDDSDMLDA